MTLRETINKQERGLIELIRQLVVDYSTSPNLELYMNLRVQPYFNFCQKEFLATLMEVANKTIDDFFINSEEDTQGIIRSEALKSNLKRLLNENR